MPLPLTADPFSNIRIIANTLSSQEVRTSFKGFTAAYKRLGLGNPTAMREAYKTVLVISDGMKSHSIKQKNMDLQVLNSAQGAISKLQPFFKNNLQELAYFNCVPGNELIDASALILISSQLEQLSLNIEARREQLSQLRHRPEPFSRV